MSRMGVQDPHIFIRTEESELFKNHKPVYKKNRTSTKSILPSDYILN